MSSTVTTGDAAGATTVPVLRDNHREDGWFAVAVVATVLETLFFALRVYGRWLRQTRWWLDDYLVLLGYISCLALNGVGIAITKGTWSGQHSDVVLAADPDSVVLFLKLQAALAVTYACAAVIPKMAIVALFTRVFIQPRFRIVCWTLQAVLAAYMLALIAALFASCTPFRANWQLPGTFTAGEHCVDVNAEYRAVSVPNVVTDIAIIILPIPVVWGLQRTTLEKLAVLSTFCLGLVGLAFSIARMVAFFTVFSDQDVLYTSAYVGIFTTLEPASYFLVSCMLTFRQLSSTPCCVGSRKSKRRRRQSADVEIQDRDPLTRKGSGQKPLAAADDSTSQTSGPAGGVIDEPVAAQHEARQVGS